MLKIRNYFCVLISFLSSAIGVAQIISPYADYSEAVAYSMPGTKDSLYFFAADNDSIFIMADTSKDISPVVDWEIYVPGTGYQSLASTDFKLEVTPSLIATGYRLTTWNGGDSTVARCWIISYSFDCEIITKDINDTLPTSAYTSSCSKYGPIKVRVDCDTAIYFNPANGDTVLYKPKLKRVWQNEKNIPNQGGMVYRGLSNSLHQYYVENAHYESMWYYFIVSDSVGTKKSDTVFVRSITPLAKFTAQYVTLIDSAYYPGKGYNYLYFYGEKSGFPESAPAVYRFINESVNAQEFLWNFGDSTKSSSLEDTIYHTYYNWSDNFPAKLTATHIVEWSGKKCPVTESSNEGDIKVAEPKLKAPEAFAINSSTYPAWRFEDISISDFEISIYSRSGIRVHHFEGNIRDWEGWDGRIGNSSNYAKTGVYFYIVKNYYDITNFDPTIKNNLSGGDNTNPDGGETQDGQADGTNTDTGEPPKDGKKVNNYHRGYIHVFNNE